GDRPDHGRARPRGPGVRGDAGRRRGGRRARAGAGRLDRDGAGRRGSRQGRGLALRKEIKRRDGLITNASFTAYLIPTALDMPPVDAELVEDPEPDAPYGAKGGGEAPAVVSTAAVVSALRAASGRELTRVPVRPDDLAGL